jgi:hypothetical protein
MSSQPSDPTPQDAKLASSAVSPIIAQARGYQTITTTDPAQARKHVRDLGVSLRTNQGKRLIRAITDGGIMVMPWTLPGQTDPVTHQFWAANPETDDNGRTRKYEFITGETTPIGVHPSIPLSWAVDPTVPLLIAEGLLKGDSALTAWLQATSPAPLPDDTTIDTDSARAALTGLMATIPTDKRVCVATIAGSGNWHTNPEWTLFDLHDRHVWLGFDADIASNPNVWREADRLTRMLTDRGAHVSYLNPGATGSKQGIDDYMAGGGTWTGLLATLTDTMPEKPIQESTHLAGNYRINNDGTALEYCEPLRDEHGKVTGSRWSSSWFGPTGLPQSFPMGGRIVAVVSRRSPTAQEDKTGVFGDGFKDGTEEAADVILELAWVDGFGKSRAGEVTCDLATLNLPPDRWGGSAKIDKHVALHPDWPPRGALGNAWLKAVKEHRADETEMRTAWTRDGWVPVDGQTVPVYMIGDQMVGDEQGTCLALSATGRYVPRITDFGLGVDDPRDLTDRDYREEVKTAIRDVVEGTYAAFTDPGTASIILVACLRPAVNMLRPRTSIYVSGPPKGGKTWTSSLVASCYGSRPSAFDSQHGEGVPGSASDSGPATEMALSGAVLWVRDDIAPSASGRQASEKAAAAEATLRQSFSGTGRHKMKPTATGWERDEGRPSHAAIITTAENDPSVASIESRVVKVNMERGALPESRQPTDDLDWIMHVEMKGAVMVRGFVRWLRECKVLPETVLPDGGDELTGWAHLVACINEHRTTSELFSQIQLKILLGRGTEVKRMSENIGDLTCGLYAFGQFLDDLGVDGFSWRLPDAVKQLMETARKGNHDHRQGGLVDAIWSLAIRTLAQTGQANVEETRGTLLMEAIRLLLETGQAHVLDAGDPKALPGGTESMAARLGWRVSTGDQMMPRGDTIGRAGRLASGRLCLALNTDVVFNLATRHYPRLVPAGSMVRSWWRDVRKEGLLAPEVSLVTEAGVTGLARLSGVTTRGAFVLVETVLGESVGVDPWEEAYESLDRGDAPFNT